MKLASKQGFIARGRKPIFPLRYQIGRGGRVARRYERNEVYVKTCYRYFRAAARREFGNPAGILTKYFLEIPRKFCPEIPRWPARYFLATAGWTPRGAGIEPRAASVIARG